MGKRFALIAAWVAATFATGVLAWGAVHLADDQVGEQAVRPLTAAEVEALPVASQSVDPVTVAPQPAPAPATTVVAVGPAAEPPPDPGLDGPVGPAVGAADQSPSSPTTLTSLPTTAPPGTTAPPPTSAPSSTTTSTTPTTSTTSTTITVPASSPEVRTYHTGGGSVTILVEPGIVRLGSATPTAGYSVSVEEDGPEKVEVKFEGTGDDDEEEYEFSARWSNGELVVEID